MILPKQVATWGELIDDIVPKALTKAKKSNSRVASSYNFRNVYFWDNVHVENSAGTATRSLLIDFPFYVINELDAYSASG